jgi:hypothetical protein
MAIIDADINLTKANLLMEDRLNGSWPQDRAIED